MLAGLLGPATSWRLPYLVVTTPCLVLSVLISLTVRDPPRGACEDALRALHAEGRRYDERVTWRKARRALRMRSNALIVLQAVPGSLPGGVIGTYLNDYLSQDKGFSVPLATVAVLVFNLGGGAGLVAGAGAGQLLYNWRKEWMPLLCGLAVLLVPAPLAFMINGDLLHAGLPATLAVAAAAGALGMVSPPNMRAALLNVNGALPCCLRKRPAFFL